MIVPNFVRQWYDESAQPANVVRGLVRELVESFCKTKGYLFLDRVKDVESVAEKLESGRYASLDALDDLYAATLVVPTLKDDAPVVNELKRMFLCKEVRGRARSTKDPTIFRFDSTRFYGRLKPSKAGRHPRVDNLLFEIQVQTAFEHAWVAVTHDVVYKGEAVDWRRQRLAASLKAAVEQIDLMVVGFDNVAEQITPHDWEPSKLGQRVVDTFSELMKEKIDNLLTPKSWVRFSNNLIALCEAEAMRREVTSRDVVRDAITAVKTHVNDPNWRSVKSVSLFQLVLGILVTENVVSGTPDKWRVLATNDLIDLFPKLNEPNL